MFAYLLFSYFYLAVQPHMAGTFPQGGPPSLMLALPGTIILLASSVAVGWAQLGIEHGSRWRLVAGLGIGAILGAVFLVVQYFEWAEKPFGLSSSPYSSLYFTITGFHMAHVVVGVVMLLALTLWSALGYFNRVRFAHIHIGALYWHFVDAVWLAVFFTFYITPLLGLQRMSDTAHPSPQRHRVSLATLLFGACAAPIFWLGQMMLGYAVSGLRLLSRPTIPRCIAAGGPLRAALLAFDTVAIAAAVAGGVVALWCCGKFVMETGGSNAAAMEIGEGRARFLALWGIMSSLWFFCAILFNAIASVTVPLCAHLMKPVAIGAALLIVAVCAAAAALEPAGAIVRRSYGAASAVDRAGRAAAGVGRAGTGACGQSYAWTLFVGVFLFWHWPAAFQWAAGTCRHAAAGIRQYSWRCDRCSGAWRWEPTSSMMARARCM